MPPREKPFDALCLVIDVGLTSSRSGFTKDAIRCASELAQWKLYEETQDRFGVVLCGAKHTNNALGYDNVVISEYNNEKFSMANFDLLEYLQKHLKAEQSDVETDWLDGVVVAIDYIKREFDRAGAIKAKKVVLLSDIGCPSNADKYQEILEAMMSEGIELTFFRPEWKEDYETDGNHENGTGEEAGPSTSQNGANAHNSDDKHIKPMTKIQMDNYQMIGNMVANTNGLDRTIDNAMYNFLDKERRKKRPTPWKVDLEIGPDARVNMTGYIRIRRENPKTWKKCLANSSDSDELKPDVTYVRNNEDQEVIEQDQLIAAYRYGSDIIPVNKFDSEQGTYDAGAKSLKVVGFIKNSDIPNQHLLGDGCMAFQTTDGDPHSHVAVSALIHAMKENEMVAVVRRVYRAKTAPKLGILVPETKFETNDEDEDNQSEEEEKKYCQHLVYIELPFMEDLRTYQFAPFSNDKVKPSDDQLNAVDELITSLLVERKKDQDDDEYNSKTKMNPYYQHLYKCLTHRALNPGKVLPEPDSHVYGIMEQPKKFAEKAKPALEKIKNLFKLEVVQTKKEKQTGAETFGVDSSKRSMGDSQEASTSKRLRADDLDLAASDSVTEVGTTTPVEDFKKLVKLGFQFSAVVVQMENVILKLVQKSVGDQMLEKIVECLKAYREACIEQKSAAFYNKFIAEIKKDFATEKKTLWAQVIVESLGLVTVMEEASSNVNTDEAKDFLAEEKATASAPTDEGDDANEEDLLDEL